MRYLDQLNRKCRHDPKMGGNTETITLPCTLVARLIGMAQAWGYVSAETDWARVPDSIVNDLVYADDEAKAWLEVKP